MKAAEFARSDHSKNLEFFSRKPETPKGIIVYNGKSMERDRARYVSMLDFLVFGPSVQ